MKKESKAKKAAPRRLRARGTLKIIGGLLVASAIVRIGADASVAIAREPSESELQSEIASASGEMCRSEEDIMPLLEALNKREERVQSREKEIQARMRALSVAETEIDRKMTELIEAEDQLRGTIALAETAAEDDLTRLTDVYATMKPKRAAALFEEMAPEFAAGFLGRMRPDAAAAIMAGMEPKSAYTVSVMLAGRNADVPTE